MIYATGDTHGQWERFEQEILPLAAEWGPDDTLLILGDFGFVFAPEATAAEAENLRRMAALPFQLAFVDGNHENFPRIRAHPQETWHGGPVHRIGPNLVHLERGGRYEIEGCSFLVMGGAYSIDRPWRTPGVSWWPEELPTDEEYARFRRTAEAAGWQTDFVLTHAAPVSVMRTLGYRSGKEEELNRFLEEMAGRLRFRRWYFGHLHLDRTFEQRFVGLYHQVACLNTDRILYLPDGEMT